MRSLMFFAWATLGLWSSLQGDYVIGFLCFIMAEAGIIVMKLDATEKKLKYIEQASRVLIKYHTARAKADGYGRDEAALEADND